MRLFKAVAVACAFFYVCAAKGQNPAPIATPDPAPIVQRVEALERRAEVAEARATETEARLTALERGSPRPSRVADNYPDLLAARVANVPAHAIATHSTYAAPVVTAAPAPVVSSFSTYSASSMMTGMAYGGSVTSACSSGSCGSGSSARRVGIVGRIFGGRGGVRSMGW